jgi:hypothetical protein
MCKSRGILMSRNGDKERGRRGRIKGLSLSEDSDGPSLFAALETLSRVFRTSSVALMAVCLDLCTRQKTVVAVVDFG